MLLGGRELFRNKTDSSIKIVASFFGVFHCIYIAFVSFFLGGGICTCCHWVVMVCPIDSIFVVVLPKNVIYWKMNMDNLQGFDA